MNALDFLVLLPLGLFLIRGWMKGLLLEVVTLLALIVGVIGSLKFAHEFVGLLPPDWQESTLFKFALYVVVFIGIYLLVVLVGKVLEHVLKVVQLNFINRLLGSLLGLAKALFLLSCFFWLLNLVDALPAETKAESVSYPFFLTFAPGIIEWVTTHSGLFWQLVEEVERSFGEAEEWLPE